MATHTLVSLALYLLPYERSHAQAYLRALGTHLGVVLDFPGVDRHRDAANNWVMGVRELLVDPRQRVLSYHYDDSVAIVHVAAPDPIVDGGDLAAILKAAERRKDQWRCLVSERRGSCWTLFCGICRRLLQALVGRAPAHPDTRAAPRTGSLSEQEPHPVSEGLPPYHCAFAHVLEDYRGGRDRDCDDLPSAIVGDGSPTERIRILSWLDHELLVFARSDNELLVNWCFNDAHLVRLLLFHGKAAVYGERARIFAEIAKAAASRTPLSRPQLATGHQAAANVTTAVENFARERRASGLDGTPLARWFDGLHAQWRGEATTARAQMDAV